MPILQSEKSPSRFSDWSKNNEVFGPVRKPQVVFGLASVYVEQSLRGNGASLKTPRRTQMTLLSAMSAP